MIHEAASRGYQASADTYERARPGYSAEAVEHLLEGLRVVPGDVVVDVGAGTGKLTRVLAAQGATTVAVEPVQAMRRIFASMQPGMPVLGGTAEALPLRAGRVAAVAVGQAFHWFSAASALAEFHRVLRPGGRLGMVWNVRDESVGWVAALTRLIDSHVGAGPTFRSGAWQRAFDSTPLFGPLHAATFPNEQRVDVDGVLARVASISYIAALPEAGRRRVTDQVLVLLADHPDTAGRDEFVIRHHTDVFWCERRH
ncbi:MAG: class I SAM-dependent methyltransferase [Acidimicrobiia bacterium]